MDNWKEWLFGLIVSCTIWYCVYSCDEQSNNSADTKDVIIEWEPTASQHTSYTPSQSSQSSPSTSVNYNWGETSSNSTNSYSEPEYTYYESHTITNNNSSNSNYENWDTEDISGFYVKLEDCESDKQAEYISNEYYSGEYIECCGDYYAKTSVKSGLYEVELSERVDRRLFKIRRSDCYVYFRHSTSLWRGDEGVMDVWSSRGTFYIKPD